MLSRAKIQRIQGTNIRYRDENLRPRAPVKKQSNIRIILK